MYEHTQDIITDTLSSSLKLISQKLYPDAKVDIKKTDKLYDDLMRGDHYLFEEYNDSYILITSLQENSFIIEIICLHIESLKLTISASHHLCSIEKSKSLVSEIKILLLNEAMRYQNQMFSKISDNTWHLASGLSHNVVIQNVIDGALKTIAHSDAAIFRIYDETKDRLIPVAMSGFNENYYKYSVSLHESVSGKVFKEHTTVILHSRDEILNSFTTLSPVREEILKNNPVAMSLLCVPVYDQHTCYGTLTLLSFSRQYVFNSLSKSLLETYSSQVALAWRNAKLYDERTESLREVEALRNQLQAQNILLKASVDLYNTMLNLSIKYNDISKFINAISQEISLSISYLDILGNHCLNDECAGLAWHALSQRERGSDGKMEAGIAGYEDLHLIPLENEGNTLAFFILNKEDLNDNVSIIMAKLQDFMIMEILKRASSFMVENKKTLNIIEKIALHGMTSDNENSLSNVGLTLLNYVTAIKIRPPIAENNDVSFISHINVLAKTLNFKNIISFVDGDNIVFIASDANEHRLHAFCDKLVSAALPDPKYKMGVSSVLSKNSFMLSLHQAGISLDTLKTRNKSGVKLFKNVGIDRLLIKHTHEELHSFIEDTLFPLSGENEKDKQLLQTILCYLDNKQSIANTAGQLQIHINTLYQRIKKFENLTHLNLNNPDDFLMVSMACHMIKFYQA